MSRAVHFLRVNQFGVGRGSYCGHMDKSGFAVTTQHWGNVTCKVCLRALRKLKT